MLDTKSIASHLNQHLLPFNFEIPSDCWENGQKILGDTFCLTLYVTQQQLGISGHLYLYYCLRFTQSHNHTHTKSLFSFGNARISQFLDILFLGQLCKPPIYGENTLDIGLWCRCSYSLVPLGQAADRLPAVFFRRWWHRFFFWRRCPKFIQV